MRILTGYMPATDGKAMVAGFDVFDQPIEAKRRTGYLPETPPLYPDMTVREYLAFVAQINGVPARSARAQVDTVMEQTRIADMADAPLRQALEGLPAAGRPGAGAHPQPGSADPRRADRRPRPQADHRDPQLIKELAGDHTIVLSTHILPEVAQTCQRVVIINKGRVVAIDTPDNLTARLGGSETMFVQVEASGRQHVGAALAAVPGVTRVSRVRASAARCRRFEVVEPKGPGRAPRAGARRS